MIDFSVNCPLPGTGMRSQARASKSGLQETDRILRLEFVCDMRRCGLICCPLTLFMFGFTMLVVTAVLFSPVVGYSPTEAILEVNRTEGGIAFQLFSEDMSPFFFFFFFSGYFLILAGV